MSLYNTYDGVAAFHQKGYPKRRPARFDDFRQTAQPAAEPIESAPDLSYQEFINGDFMVDTPQLTA